MSATLVDDSDVSATIAGIMSGDVFTKLASDCVEQRTAELKIVLERVAVEGTRIAWVGNPLRAPLTIERFLLQIVGPEVDLRVERGPAELAAQFGQRTGAETRLLVIVQQPETINPETREQLAALAGYLGEVPVQVQFLFVGSAALRLPEVAQADLAPVAPMVAQPETTPVAAEPPLRAPLPMALFCTLVGIGIAALGFLPARPLLVGILPPLTGSALKPPTAVDLLRNRFDAFLAERAGTLPLSEAQKDELFDEFRRRQSQYVH